jgi:hypothetical protein
LLWTFPAGEANCRPDIREKTEMAEIEELDRILKIDSAHYVDASAREKLVEHVFLGDLLRALWLRKVGDVAILRPEVDSGGYDLALEHRGEIRHVQLKSSHRHAKRAAITANIRLLERPAACILWIYFDPETLLLGPFLWFGSAPGEKIPALGDKIATHTKHNAQPWSPKPPSLRSLSIQPIP